MGRVDADLRLRMDREIFPLLTGKPVCGTDETTPAGTSGCLAARGACDQSIIGLAPGRVEAY